MNRFQASVNYGNSVRNHILTNSSGINTGLKAEGQADLSSERAMGGFWLPLPPKSGPYSAIRILGAAVTKILVTVLYYEHMLQGLRHGSGPSPQLSN